MNFCCVPVSHKTSVTFCRVICSCLGCTEQLCSRLAPPMSGSTVSPCLQWFFSTESLTLADRKFAMRKVYCCEHLCFGIIVGPRSPSVLSLPQSSAMRSLPATCFPRRQERLVILVWSLQSQEPKEIKKTFCFLSFFCLSYFCYREETLINIHGQAWGWMLYLA